MAKIKRRTIKAKLRYSGLISINCLEFIIIIISYNTTLGSIELLGKFLGIPHPKILILANNTAGLLDQEDSFFFYYR